MRNLKKVLSLALALVMLLGMMVMGAGAATKFKDDPSIKNQEAVAVVSGIGVFEGDGTGNFNPTGTLTRAQAAVLIAKLDLGAAFGNLATTNASTFSDVPASHWAKAYIDYCAARGLIAGDGAGKFLPDQEVNGVGFALMVCRVLGYEDANEGIGGAGWEAKAAALARKAGLTKDVSIGSQIITRDEMAQVAYNALTADMVGYSNSAITIGDVTIPAGKAQPRQHLGNSYAHYLDGANNTTDPNVQLCEEKFPDLKLKDDRDDFQRAVYTWRYGKDEIGSYQSEQPTFLYTAATTGSTVSKDLTKYEFGNGVRAVVNGLPSQVITKAADKSTDPKDVIDSVAELTGNGVAVEVYANKDREITDIIVVNTYLMKVRQVSSTSVSLRTVAGTNGPSVAAVGETNDAFGVLSGLKLDDYVLVTPVTTDDGANYTVAGAYVPETVSGALTRVDRNASDNTTSALTVAGTAYNVAKVQAQIEGQPALNSITSSNLTAVTKKDIGLYLDSYGYAVCAVDAVAATNYLYVTNAYQSLVDGRIVTLVEGVSTDGTVVSVNVGTADNPSASAAVAGKLVSYTAANSTQASTYRAEYVLTEVTTSQNTTAYAAVGTTITAPATVLGAVPYAGGVKFIFVNNGQVAVRDGVQNVALTSGAQYKALVVKNGAGNMVVSAVFVPSDPTDIGSNLLYLSAFKGFTEVNNTGAARYDAYIEGAKETIVVKGTNSGLAGAFYSYSKNEDLGLYTVNFYADSGNPKTGVATSARISNLTSTSDITDNRLINLNTATNLNAGSAVVTNLVSGFNVYSVRDIYDLLVAGRKVTVAAIYNDATGSAKKGTVEYLYVTAITDVGADAPLTKPTESNVTNSDITDESGSGGAKFTVDVQNGAGEKTTGAVVNLDADAMTAVKAGSADQDLAIKTDIGTVTIPQEALTTGGELNSSTTLKVEVAKETVNNSDVPTNETGVYGFSITVSNQNGVVALENLPANHEIVYKTTVAAGLTSVKVYRVVNGTPTKLDNGDVSYNSGNGELSITLDHLSDFVVTTKKNKTPAATVPSDAKTVTVDDTATVAVTKADSTATIAATSSDTTKATVAVSGNNVVITGVAAGSATVTITVTAGNTAEYSNVTQAVSVTVNAAAPATHTITINGAKASEYTATADAGEVTSYTEGTQKVVTLTANAAGAKTGYTVTVTGVTGISPVHTVAGTAAVPAKDAVFAEAAGLTKWAEETDYYTQADSASEGAIKGSDGKYYTKVNTESVAKPAGDTTYYTMTAAAEDAVAAKTDKWTITIPNTAKADITITVATGA